MEHERVKKKMIDEEIRNLTLDHKLFKDLKSFQNESLVHVIFNSLWWSHTNSLAFLTTIFFFGDLKQPQNHRPLWPQWNHMLWPKQVKNQWLSSLLIKKISLEEEKLFREATLVETSVEETSVERKKINTMENLHRIYGFRLQCGAQVRVCGIFAMCIWIRWPT